MLDTKIKMWDWKRALGRIMDNYIKKQSNVQSGPSVDMGKSLKKELDKISKVENNPKKK